MSFADLSSKFKSVPSICLNAQSLDNTSQKQKRAPITFPLRLLRSLCEERPCPKRVLSLVNDSNMLMVNTALIPPKSRTFDVLTWSMPASAHENLVSVAAQRPS